MISKHLVDQPTSHDISAKIERIRKRKEDADRELKRAGAEWFDYGQRLGRVQALKEALEILDSGPKMKTSK